MGIEKDFSEMMPHTIVLAAQSSLDSYGRPSWGSGTSYQCRVVYQQTMTRDADGREVVQRGKALLYGVALSAAVQYKLTLPDGTQPRVLDVKQLKDQNGDHHTEIGFG